MKCWLTNCNTCIINIAKIRVEQLSIGSVLKGNKKKKKEKCKARLHTKALTENVEILKYVNEHCHSATKDVVEAKSAQATLKVTSETSHQSSRVLVAQAAATLDESSRYKNQTLNST